MTDRPAPMPSLRDAHPLKAAAWMMGAIVSFSSMAVAGREVAFELDTFEIMTYRSLIGVLLVVTVGGLAGTLGEVRTQRIGLHTIRNISHFTGQNLWFYAVATAPLAQVFALEFSAPIWVALAAPLILQEKLTRMRLMAAFFGFGGLLLVAQPDFHGLAPGLGAAAMASLGFAGSILATKLLTRTETITCILLWLTVMQSVFGILCAGIDGDIAVPSAVSIPLLIVIGIAGLSAHFCLTTALSIAPATIATPFDFLRLPVIAAVGMLVYAEPLRPFVFLGAAIIFGANYLNVWTETRRRRRHVAET